MEKLELYLKRGEDCLESVRQKMSLLKFNIEQCRYLADKLQVVVQSASLFLEVLRAEHHGLQCSFMDITKQVEIFKLQLGLTKQIENFVQCCCKESWIQAAMTLTNVWEYVASIGFNLELCRVAFRMERPEAGSLTLDEVEDIHKAEIDIVKKKAFADTGTLVGKVILEMPSLSSENKDLASYLLQRLKQVERIPAFSLSGSSSGSGDGEDGGFWGRLFKRVKPIGQLGRGASGTVEKANWLGTLVAKKTFFGMENPDFMKEVEILSPLCHPNVMSMFCCAKNQRSCSIIMELMDEDLFTLMQRRLEENSAPPFPILEAVDIMLQIGEGVNYLHSQRIVHRDLKSMNILVKSVRGKDSEDGYVHAKVADFGLSKTKQKSTRYSCMTSNVGTNRWMPPEIIKFYTGSQDSSSISTEGPNNPFKCDTYSFGMVCFEILTGDIPFSAIYSNNAVKMQVLEGGRPELPEDPEVCPPMLKDLIERCWSSNPKMRPTFPEICSDLKYLKYLRMRAARVAADSVQQCDCSQHNFCGTRPDYCGTGCKSGPCTGTSSPGGGSPPSGAGFSAFFTKSVFESWFPNRLQSFYTYEAFIAAAGAFPTFCTAGSLDDQKREVAAFFGNVHHESGGLQFVEEIGKSYGYCDKTNTKYPCAPEKLYFGRGPFQLSWNYNYGECGKDLGLDLLGNPDQVAQDGTVAFKTAVWFWMKRDCHGAIVGSPPSFAGTIRIINGGVECGHGFDRRVENRVSAYTSFCSSLGVDPALLNAAQIWRFL